MEDQSENSRPGPLAGLKVIELAHVMAGPVCGLMLADLGADVIKVEKVPGGDDSRRFLPPAIDSESAAFMMVNRNKRGIAVNLKSKEGRDIVRELLKGADVVIENYRHDTMEKLGLGYDTLKADNPGLIYCEISGFGRSGPYASRGGFDLIAQGMSGLMSITGESKGRPPVKTGPPVTDITAGILAALGVVSAYANRMKTGRGQRVDTSLFEAGIIQTFWQSAMTLATGVSPGPMGSAHPLNAPYQAFETSDGWLTVGAANQANWLRLIDVLDAPHLQADERFSENGRRTRNLDELVEALSPYFKTQPTETWLTRLEKAGIPAGPVLTIDEMLKNPQTIAREMVTEVPHTALGKVKTIGAPIKFSETQANVLRGAPLYGEHTQQVLQELGYSVAAINALASGDDPAIVCSE